MILRRLFPKMLPLAALLMLTMAATTVHAHPGHPHPYDEVDEFDSPPLAEAVMHPFTGLDHLVAALAVGVLAWSMGRRQGGVMAMIYLGSLALGWGLARMGLHVPMLEQGIALSIVAVGVVLLLQARASTLVKGAALMAMGVWHGGAHGLEMPTVAPALGLLLGTGLAVALGVLMAVISQKMTPVPYTRFAGATAVLVGVMLVVQRLG